MQCLLIHRCRFMAMWWLKITNTVSWRSHFEYSALWSLMQINNEKKTHMLWKHPTSYSYHSYSFFLVHRQGSQKSIKLHIEHFLTSWPWPLTYDLDLLIWPRYLSTWPPCKNSSLHVCSFGQDSETDRQTDTRCQNYYIHHVRDVGCNNHKWLDVDDNSWTSMYNSVEAGLNNFHHFFLAI